MHRRFQQIIAATCTALLLCTFAFALASCAQTDGAASTATETRETASVGTEPTVKPDESTDERDGKMDANYEQGVVLVVFSQSATVAQVEAAVAQIGATCAQVPSAEAVAAGDPVVVNLPEGMTVEQGVAACKDIPLVVAVQPNFIYTVQ